jgi:hypothetical protein
LCFCCWGNVGKGFRFECFASRNSKEIGSPSDSETLVAFFNKIDVEPKWVGGFFDDDVKFIRGVTASTKSWAVILREGNPLGHAVLIYGFDENGLVKIKDPYDQTLYEMTADDLYGVLSEIVLRSK